VDVHCSARKHGIDDNDIPHAAHPIMKTAWGSTWSPTPWMTTNQRADADHAKTSEVIRDALRAWLRTA